jgi:hypothetical protein
MWYWKALKEDRLLAVYTAASVVGIASMLSSLAIGWDHSATFLRVSLVVGVLALGVGIVAEIRHRKTRYTSEQ